MTTAFDLIVAALRDRPEGWEDVVKENFPCVLPGEWPLLAILTKGYDAADDIAGPASSTNNAIALFDGVTGQLLKESPATINSGDFNTPGSVSAQTVKIGGDSSVAILDASGVTGFDKTFLFPNANGTLALTSDLVSASTTVAGFVELATDAETVSGVNSNVAVTPASLIARLAVEPHGYFLSDDFRDPLGTALSDHTGQRANWWVRGNMGGAGTLVISNPTSGVNAGNTTVMGNHSGEGIVSSTQSPRSADYSAIMGIKYFTTNTASIGPMIRTDYLGANGYGGCLNLSNSRWELFKVVANTRTVLGFLAATLVADTTYVLECKAEGSSISLLLNGVVIVPAVTDTTFTLPGSIAIYTNNASTATTGAHGTYIRGQDNDIVAPWNFDFGLVTIGDSNFTDVNTVGSVTIPQRIARGLGGVPLQQCDVSGRTLQGWAGGSLYASWSIPALARMSTLVTRRMVIIELGVNDVIGGRTKAQMIADLTTICTAFRTEGATDIGVATIPPSTSISGGAETVRTTYNTDILTPAVLAAAGGDFAIDAAKAIPATANTAAFQGDFLHFADVGKQMWADEAVYSASVGLGIRARRVTGRSNQVFSKNPTFDSDAAASVPGVLIAGTGFAGNAGNSRPLFLIQQTGAAAWGGINNGAVFGINVDATASSSGRFVDFQNEGNSVFNVTIGGDLVTSGAGTFPGTLTARSSNSNTSGGVTSAALSMGSAGPQVRFGADAPTISSTQGSIYLCSNGVGNRRGYFNTTGSTAWAPIETSEMQTATLAAAATTLAITAKMVKLTGDAGANTLATITGGVAGQTLTILFVDALVTITDTAASTADTINLSAAFVSAANKTLMLISDGNKWFETARSTN